MNQNLPEHEEDFLQNIYQYFPNFYDLKYLISEYDDIKNGGLAKLAFSLEVFYLNQVKRIGPAHQAGSDSLITLMSFYKLLQSYIRNSKKLENGLNVLYGIGSGQEQKVQWNNKYQNVQ